MSSTQRNSGSALRARQEAFKELCRRYPDEWEMILAHYRTSYGLPPKSGGPNVAQLQQRLERYQRLAEKVQAELESVHQELPQ